MIDWFVNALRAYSEIAIFLSWFRILFRVVHLQGLGLGAVTDMLIAAVVIGQLNITICLPHEPTFFLMFLFAIGYGVGPQRRCSTLRFRPAIWMRLRRANGDRLSRPAQRPGQSQIPGLGHTVT